jgi:hypothetical protein
LGLAHNRSSPRLAPRTRARDGEGAARHGEGSGAFIGDARAGGGERQRGQARGRPGSSVRRRAGGDVRRHSFRGTGRRAARTPRLLGMRAASGRSELRWEGARGGADAEASGAGARQARAGARSRPYFTRSAPI